MADLFINDKKASLSQEAFQHFHGSSVFTTLRSWQGMPIFLESHWRRVCAHAEYLGYKIPEQHAVFDFLFSHLSSLPSDQKIRIILAENDYALTFEPYIPPSPSIFHAVQVIISDIRVHPDYYWLKTGNSLCYQQALRQAQLQGAFEALLCDHEGYIADGSRTGLMMFDGKEFVALEGGLKSIMVEQVTKHLQALGVRVVNRRLKPAQITGQLLLLNSLMGIIPVGFVQNDLLTELIDTFKNGITATIPPPRVIPYLTRDLATKVPLFRR